MGDTAEYKKQKEDFVSNLSGGPISEINYVTTAGIVSAFLWSVLQSRQQFFQEYRILTFVVDYFINIGTILLANTLYAKNPVLLNVLLLSLGIFIWLLPPNTRLRKRPLVPPHVKDRKKDVGGSSRGGRGGGDGVNGVRLLGKKPFLTTYRGSMMVMTCVAILAVDFRLFPRRFAKVETWGTSLMDLGVGSFVFSAGVVAARPVLKEQVSGTSQPLAKRLAVSIKHSLPLLLLGIIRTLSVKGLDYAEHVSEYGVHWNFFFTLGFLPPFVAAFQALLKYIPSFPLLAFLLAGAYQLCLEMTDLKVFVLTAPRVDFLSRNKEGIFGFWGYLSIFLAGQGTGMTVLPRSYGLRGQRALLFRLAGWFAIYTSLYLLTTSYSYGLGLSVSRRLANLPYVLWVSAFNNAQILACAVIDTIFFSKFYEDTKDGSGGRAEEEGYKNATSRILRSMNRNGLAVFLVANLMTGAVNLGVRTLDVGAGGTIGILVGYMLVVSGVAVGLDAYDITVKL